MTRLWIRKVWFSPRSSPSLLWFHKKCFRGIATHKRLFSLQQCRIRWARSLGPQSLLRACGAGRWLGGKLSSGPSARSYRLQAFKSTRNGFEIPLCSFITTDTCRRRNWVKCVKIQKFWYEQGGGGKLNYDNTVPISSKYSNVTMR